MNIIKRLFNKELRRENKKKRLEYAAERIVDVTYVDGELWLVFNAMMVAPLTTITGKPDINECMDVVAKIREIYILRNL